MIVASEERWNKEIAALPKEAADNTPDGLKRSVYKERLKLLEELKGLRSRYDELVRNQQQLIAGEKGFKQELEFLERNPEPALPKQIDLNSLEAARKDLTGAAEELDRLITYQKQRQELLSSLAQQNQLLQNRHRTAEKNRDKFKELLAQETGDQKKILELQLENALLDIQVADFQQSLIEQEQIFEKETLTARDLQLQVASLRHKIRDRHYTAYQKAMEARQNVEIQKLQEDLKNQKEKQQKAGSEQEQFLATWETDLLTVRHRVAKLHKLKTDLINIISRQEKRTKMEREELKVLQEMIQRSGVTETISNELITAFRKLEERKRTIEYQGSPLILKDVAKHLNRMYEINALLLTLRDSWKTRTDQTLTTIPVRQKKGFLHKADGLHDQMREALLNEKRVLMEVESLARQLELLPREQRHVQQETEHFILSKIFWIQDAEPFGLVAVKRLFVELFSTSNPYSLFNWSRQVVSVNTIKQVVEALSQRRVFLMALIMFVIIPLVLYFLRRHLKEESVSSVAPAPTVSAAWRVSKEFVRGLLRSSLWPLYILVFAFMIDDLKFPAAIGTVLERSLIHIAVFIMLWKVNTFIFSKQGIGVRYGLVTPDVGKVLNWAIRLGIISYLIFLLPWMIFRVEPFHFISLPRLGFTLFEISVVVIISGLFHRRSPLVTQWFETKKGTSAKTQRAKQGILLRNWGWISSLGFLFMVATVMLDIMGYRFGATYLTNNTLLTAGTLWLLYIVNRIVLAMVGHLIGRRRKVRTSNAPGEQVFESRSVFLERFRRYMWWVSMLLGLWFLSGYWGINESLFQMLQEYSLYSTTGPDGAIAFVTMADLVKFIVMLVGMIWLVRHLGWLFDILFFSKSTLDTGMRYAIVTMSKYLIFFIGLFVAFSFLKLNLAQIGWLVAAMSVGLGFGLQEIVANFVSGIILLIERPIRIGDTISVGMEFGKVSKITIRSTTIVTPDQQELLIPNKSLITQDVKNWTLQNQQTRLMIPVGVSYASDVDQVTDTLLEIASNHPDILKDPAPQALMMMQGPSSLDFELRVFLGDVAKRPQVTDALNKAIIKRFRELDIEIPYPQQDVYIRSAPDNIANANPDQTMIMAGGAATPGVSPIVTGTP
ncbi:mechanosensitive ion channel domain-containing protein [Magnetococcales bacterium HHB-1]